MQDCCIKIRICKVISIFVSLCLLISNISITAYCTENVNEMTLDTFYDELTIMLNAGENYSSIIRVESTESGETITEDKISTNRLIVSTDSNEDLPKTMVRFPGLKVIIIGTFFNIQRMKMLVKLTKCFHCLMK